MKFLLPTATLLLLTGCPGEETGDSKEPEDTDTGETGETDSTETDTEPTTTGAEVFTGSSAVRVTSGEEVLCDVEASLVGTRYVGICDDCEFEIAMEATVTSGDPDACASVYPVYSFIEEGSFSNLVLGYAPYYYLYGNYYVTNYWVTEFHYQGYGYYGYYNGDYAQWVSMNFYGTDYGATFTRSGDELSWALESSSLTYPYYYYCGNSATNPPEAAAVTAGTGSIACDGTNADVWTFVVDAADVMVSVDTVSADTTFDPRMWVQDASGCTVGYSDDAFACSFPPPTYECPSLLFPDAVVGDSYQVVVTSYGDCSTPTVDYALKINNGSAATLVGDDVDAATLISVSGSGTLSL